MSFQSLTSPQTYRFSIKPSTSDFTFQTKYKIIELVPNSLCTQSRSVPFKTRRRKEPFYLTIKAWESTSACGAAAAIGLRKETIAPWTRALLVHHFIYILKVERLLSEGLNCSLQPWQGKLVERRRPAQPKCQPVQECSA